MEEKITARIAALTEAEQQAVLQLTVIRNLITELRALLTPDAPIVTEGSDAEQPASVTTGAKAP